jgi:hypothetical protein
VLWVMMYDYLGHSKSGGHLMMLSSISTLLHFHSSFLSKHRHLINYGSRNNFSFFQHARSNRGSPSRAYDTFHRT